jgi:hypothetical protein
MLVIWLGSRIRIWIIYVVDPRPAFECFPENRRFHTMSKTMNHKTFVRFLGRP